MGARGNDFAGGGAIVAALLRQNRALRRLNLRGTRLKPLDCALICDAALAHPRLGALELDVPLCAPIKAHLVQNSAAAAAALAREPGVALIASVYRAAFRAR